jgi:hypothetical protein
MLKTTYDIYISLTGDKAKEAAKFKEDHPSLSHPDIYMAGIKKLKEDKPS